MATDTLVMFTEVGDALCVDIVEPVGHWRLFFRDAPELGALVRDALNHEGLSVDSAVAVFRDYVDPLIEWQESKRRAEARTCEERPPAAGKAMDASREVFLGAVKFVCASVLVAALGLFWIVGAGMAWRAWR